MRKLAVVLLSMLMLLFPTAMPLMTVYAADKPAATSIDDRTTTTIQTTGTTSGPTASTAQKVPLENIDTGNLQSRIDAYKKSLGSTPSAAIADKIKKGCEAAQGKLKTLNTGNEQVASDRMKIYNDTLDKLQTILDRSEPQQLDVATLKTDVATLQSKIKTLEGQIKAYRQGLSDLVNLKCAADATGFEAALLSTRTAQTSVLNSVKDIRSFLTNTIRPDLDALKKQLDAQVTPAKTGTGGN